jgi:aminopeptidase-like protein
MEKYFDRLWPILRSITGEGVRETHRILSEIIPLEHMEIPSGTEVLDWTVPDEWVVREAYVITPEKRKILDVKENNLHLLNYSIGFRGKVSREELESHLYSLPENPTAIPYVTSYYQPRWGFCISHRERERLPQGEYEVVVDCEHKKGSMTLSQCVLPGKTRNEVLISAYTCHPSLANNELCGPLIAAFLYRRLTALKERKLTYRFFFGPETIGAIAQLDQDGDRLKRDLLAGYVLTCIGTNAPLQYKRSRLGTSLADRAAELVLKTHAKAPVRTLDFFPTGSNERQYCSQGFNLPVGSLFRTRYDEYPEYHTSLDNREFVSFTAMEETVDVCFQILQALELNRRYRAKHTRGEPCFSKHGLKPSFEDLKGLQWLNSLSDGENDLIVISKLSGHSLPHLANLATQCVHAGLLEPVE